MLCLVRKLGRRSNRTITSSTFAAKDDRRGDPLLPGDRRGDPLLPDDETIASDDRRGLRLGLSDLHQKEVRKEEVQEVDEKEFQNESQEEVNWEQAQNDLDEFFVKLAAAVEKDDPRGLGLSDLQQMEERQNMVSEKIGMEAYKQAMNAFDADVAKARAEAMDEIQKAKWEEALTADWEDGVRAKKHEEAEKKKHGKSG